MGDDSKKVAACVSNQERVILVEKWLLRCIRKVKVESPRSSNSLPVPIRVPQQTDSSVPALDVLESRENLFDILPKDDIGPIDLRAAYFLDVWLANQAKRLCHPHVLDGRSTGQRIVWDRSGGKVVVMECFVV